MTLVFSKKLHVLFRHASPALLGGACLWLLSMQLESVNFAAVWIAVLSIPAGNWAVALFGTILSFLAVSRYDVIAHRHFQMRRPPREAMLAGATAIGIGQTTGAGAFVGGFVRWRMCPDTSAKDAAKVTGFVTVTFMGTLAVTIALASFALPTPHVPPFLPVLILISAAAICLTAFFFPVLSSKGRKLSLPTLSALGALLALCILDTGFASVAFWMLLPPDTALPFTTLMPVFLIALGAAIFSGSPGGVGPFELTLVALLPSQPETGLLCAVLAFRIVYYALPAVLAGAVFLHRLWHPAPIAQPPSVNGFVPFEATTPSPQSRAELAVLRQNGGAILTYATGSCGTVRTGQTLLALFDPFQGDPGAMTPALLKAAREQNRIAYKYKIDARQAVLARKSGWAVAHISDEAVLAPPNHTTDGATFRQLRRKLRQAQKANVTVSSGDGACRSRTWPASPPFGRTGMVCHVASPWDALRKATSTDKGCFWPIATTSLWGLSVSTPRPTNGVST